MSDYELVYLFVEHNNALQTSLMNYVAVLFGFLIAGYLVASKLESRMVLSSSQCSRWWLFRKHLT